MINIFHLSTNTTGGWVTFTYHLTKSLQAIGEEVRLFKINSNTEFVDRSFGYNLTYQNVDINVARGIVMEGGGLITAIDKRFANRAQYLRELGAWTVIHDPTEFRNLPGCATWDRVFVIRPTMKIHLPKATFILHPYVRLGPYEGPHAGAISVSRIDFDKRTDIILDANRFLRMNYKTPVQIYGFENRLYTKFRLVPLYPEWEQSISAFPRTPDAAYRLCRGKEFVVDMSDIAGDGGGTQYSFLEGMDAGCIPVLNSAWMNGEMQDGFNCIMCDDGYTLSELVGNSIDEDWATELRINCEYILKRHHGPEIAKEFAHAMKGAAVAV